MQKINNDILEEGIIKVKFTQVVLILSNRIDKKIINMMQNIKEALGSDDECILLLHEAQDKMTSSYESVKRFNFDNSVLTKLGYTPQGNSLIPGNNHFPAFEYYLQNREFDFYWVIENDVHFDGDWRVFLDSFRDSNIDFISGHIKDFSDIPLWHWWNTLVHPLKHIRLKNRIKSFNPVYRLSNRALEELDKHLKDGWSGHHEVLIPSILNSLGYSIADFGGEGKYVISGFKNKFYNEPSNNLEGWLTNGIYRWRPAILPDEYQNNKLHHPVKGEI